MKLNKEEFVKCFGKNTADAQELELRKLRVAGVMNVVQHSYECNCCGKTFQGMGFGMVRGGVPVIVCFNCCSDHSVSEMSIEQLVKWEKMLNK